MKGAAWSIPVIAMAVATPLAAASEPPIQTRDLLRFTNVTATVGKTPNTIYANTKVQVTDGPDAVHQVMLTVSLSRDGVTYSQTWPLLAGWDSTKKVEVEFPNVPKGGDVLVTFTAWALEAKTIVGQAIVATPSWWS